MKTYNSINEARTALKAATGSSTVRYFVDSREVSASEYRAAAGEETIYRSGLEIIAERDSAAREAAVAEEPADTLYVVTTGSDINPHRLHSIVAEEFCTPDLDVARRVFEAEVAQLAQEYDDLSQLAYSPNDHEMSHAVRCTIYQMDPADPEDMKEVERRDYFFER